MRTLQTIFTVWTALSLVLPALAVTNAAPRRVLCWGDSITEGMGMARADAYPARLQALLGDGYKVYNSGDGGENAVTIPARQGALPLVTAADLAFPEGIRKIRLGSAADNGLRAPGETKIKLTQPLGRELSVNPVTIGSGSYRLSFTDFKWNTPGHPISYTLWLERDAGAGAGAVTIPAGTKATFASVDAVPGAYCEIILMGANGGWDDRIGNLVAAHRAMIARRGADKPYLVVVPYWGGVHKTMSHVFKTVFGDHAVDFRAEAAAQNRNLTSLMYRNRPDCHLNADGYAFLAQILYARGKTLGYW